MNKKELILFRLNELKNIYQENEEKKWNTKALINAIDSIKKYEGNIISGEQLKNELKGIGDKISKRIDEILKNGTLEELKNKLSNIDNLLLITGIGLVRAKKWRLLGINNIEDVKDAIKNKKIITNHHIDIGIKYYEDFQIKIPRHEIDNIKLFLKNLISTIDNKIIFEICGSYRRGLSESGDIDVLVTYPIENKNILKIIVDKLNKNNFIIDNLTSNGNTKFMGVCKLVGYNIARRIDIRVVDYESYYTSLIYFTGNKNFNIYLRNLALSNNYTINEYFVTDNTNNTLISLNNEKEIFDILKIPYLIPSERNI